ncbi:MAG: VWA domain-containing protein [Burkholderiales bacterium]|nr:VWA domain-containing protein [Burkholderiales bacterium]
MNAPAPGGRLAANIAGFARLLRGAGLPVGPARVLDALAALELAGMERRDDFYWTLAAVFLGRRDQLELFDEAFRAYWSESGAALHRPQLPPVAARIAPGERAQAVSRRLAEALARRPGAHRDEPRERTNFEASLTFSARERLGGIDFESMSAEELAAARAAIARLTLRLPRPRTRRYAPHARGERVDPRGSLRASLRCGGSAIALRRRTAVRRAPPLVALCDVSGSMSRYTQMFLALLHAAVNDCARVHAFTFGTRLNNVTRQLRYRDPDLALARVARAVGDWSGGTRIGSCLKEFNARWSRRVLGQGAVVLLLSDGLDGDAGAGLDAQMYRLARSCRRLFWLNPLLRYEGFEARPAGIRAMLPHVDEFLPAHDLDSLADLARRLAEPAGVERPRRSGRMATHASEDDRWR